MDTGTDKFSNKSTAVAMQNALHCSTYRRADKRRILSPRNQSQPVLHETHELSGSVMTPDVSTEAIDANNFAL